MAQSPDGMAAILLRHRLSSELAAAGCEWFLSVYLEQLAVLYHGAEQRSKRPHKLVVAWPTFAAVTKGYNAPHLPDLTLNALRVVLIKLGFLPVPVPTITNKTASIAWDFTVPTGKTPRTAWDFVTALLRMRDVLDVVDAQAARIVALTQDYVLSAGCASSEHFAMAWLVGPYLEAVDASVTAQAAVKCSTKGASVDPIGASCVIDPLTVALELRATTERVARKHWGPKVDKSKAVDTAWSAIADLFLRMGFPMRNTAEGVLRFNRARKEQPDLSNVMLRIASLDVPATHAARVGVLVALHELDTHHQAHHAKSEGRVRFDRIAKQQQQQTKASSSDDVVASLFMAVNAANGVVAAPTEGCFDDDDNDNAASVGVIPVVAADASEVEALKDTVRALLETVDAQRGIIDKARASEVKSDTNDAQIVTEVAGLRTELDTLRKEAAQLRKEAEQSSAASLEAAKSADAYRKSYEETLARLEEARSNVAQASKPAAGASRPVTDSIVPPPPPPPPPPAKPTGTLVGNATKAKQAIKQAGERIDTAEKSIDAKLADVGAKAKANAGQSGVTLEDIKQQGTKLRKVSAATNRLAVHKDEKNLTDTLRAALAKINKAVHTGGDTDEDEAKESDDAFKQHQWRIAEIYFGMLLHSLDEDEGAPL